MCNLRWWEEDENKRENIPVQIPALELNVTYTCNLQCEYCAHLGRYIKGIVPLEQIKEWLASWKHKVLPCVVRILGGEPLLHKDLASIVRAVDETWGEAHRIIVTNGLIERSDPDFLRAVRETGTHIWVSVHHDTPKINSVIDANVARWQGVTVKKNSFTAEWRKCYRLDNGKPVPFNTNPKNAFDRCSQQRNCMTLLDNHLYMCPPAALYQYGYNNQFIGEEWKLAADYKPLPPTATWREVADFVECKHEQAICRLCPDRWVNATPQEKANLHTLENKQYLAVLL
jgi:wyosine [tRNA(Phe)-imidazoG37] synthetase (radical SAM superfamily)